MKKIKTISKILYSIAASLIVILILIGFSSLLKVKIIETNARSPDVVGLPFVGGKYIFSLPEDKIKDYFLKNPSVKEVKVVKKFPKTVFIDVIYRYKTAVVSARNGLFIVDEGGYVFEKIATNSGLPLLNIETKEVNLGTNITQNSLSKALKIVRLSQDSNIRIVNITPLDETGVSLTLDQGTLVFIDSNSQAEEIVSSLQMIIKRFTIEGKILSKIDFRFEKPVISF